MIKIGNKKNGDIGEYVGRPSVLGNPFVINDVYNRKQVIEKYEEWLREKINVDNVVRNELKRLKEIYEIKGELILVCSCSPKSCHAEVIKKAILEWGF